MTIKISQNKNLPFLKQIQAELKETLDDYAAKKSLTNWEIIDRNTCQTMYDDVTEAIEIYEQNTGTSTSS